MGTLLDKTRLYVAAYSVDSTEMAKLGSKITDRVLKAVPPTHYPDIFDVMMVVGGISGAVFVVLIVARVMPVFSFWEMIEGLRLRAVRPFLRTSTVILGKPD